MDDLPFSIGIITGFLISMTLTSVAALSSHLTPAIILALDIAAALLLTPK